MVEMKLLLVATLSCIASSEIHSFSGGWTIVYTFPDPPMVPICDRLFIVVDPSTCICDGNTVPVTTVRGYESEFNLSDTPLNFPTLIVNSPDEVASALKASCECNGRKHQQIVFRRINDNCFVQYEVHSGREYAASEPNHANLLVKRVPKTAREVEALCKTDDLLPRTGYLTCPSLFTE